MGLEYSQQLIAPARSSSWPWPSVSRPAGADSLRSAAAAARLAISRALPRAFEQPFGRLEIGRFEAFSEPLVDRSDEPLGVVPPPVGVAQTPKTHGAPQFPKEGALSVRQVHRSRKKVVDDFVLRLAGSQQDLAFDAESLREPPDGLVSVYALQRLFGDSEGILMATSCVQDLAQTAEERRVKDFVS